MRPLSVLQALMCAACLGTLACANALVFSTATLTAIDINTVEGGQQHVTLGYKRSEGVVMPVRKKKSTPARKEAFSVLSAMRYDSGSLLLPNASGTHVKSVFATGKAAAQANAPEAVANAFTAFAGDLFSPEAAFLEQEIDTTLRALVDPKQTNALNAAWSSFMPGTPDARRYATYLVQQEKSQGELQAMLVSAKHALAGGAGSPPALADDEKSNPGSEIIELLNQNAGNVANLNAILDALGPKLPGPDQISSATPVDLLMSLVEVAAQRGETQTLRDALSAIVGVART